MGGRGKVKVRREMVNGGDCEEPNGHCSNGCDDHHTPWADDEEEEAGCSGQEVSIDDALQRAQAQIQELELDPEIRIVAYDSEERIGDIMGLISRDLSEPYSIYTYRYFLHNWPHLSYLVPSLFCK